MAGEYDVVVIGAGPGGSSAALHSARNGLRTLLVEEHSMAGEPVHCGECLSHLCVERLGLKPPEKVISLHVNGVRVLFPDKTSSILNEKGYVLEKHLFEQWLVDEAAKAGAEIRFSTKVTGLDRSDGFWKVISNDSEFKTRIVIDASGVNSVVSGKLNLNKRFDSVIGLQYEMTEIKNDGYLDFYLWPKLAPHGYLWMIPKNSTRANVGLVTSEKTKAKAYLDEFIRAEGWQNKKIVKTFGGLIPASGPMENTCGDGIMLVGDAAGFTSPLFEGGTHLAMVSGKMSANVAKEAVEKNDTSKRILLKYEKMWRAEFPDYSKLIYGKDTLYQFTEQELNQVGWVMPKDVSNMGIVDMLNTGANLLFKYPHLLRKGVMKTFQAFKYSRAEHYGW
ncbi:NAD(P)/FAD-dependent oxidoreductase [Candidatus Micrarchaeota archaeon]|nr:NAD(P)/FAD-dependent oxidoreductase [Candidatus Micrarchaeota archaeon]